MLGGRRRRFLGGDVGGHAQRSAAQAGERLGQSLGLHGLGAFGRAGLGLGLGHRLGGLRRGRRRRRLRRSLAEPDQLVAHLVDCVVGALAQKPLPAQLAPSVGQRSGELPPQARARARLWPVLPDRGGRAAGFGRARARLRSDGRGYVYDRSGRVGAATLRRLGGAGARVAEPAAAAPRPADAPGRTRAASVAAARCCRPRRRSGASARAPARDRRSAPGGPGARGRRLGSGRGASCSISARSARSEWTCWSASRDRRSPSAITSVSRSDSARARASSFSTSPTRATSSATAASASTARRRALSAANSELRSCLASSRSGPAASGAPSNAVGPGASPTGGGASPTGATGGGASPTGAGTSPTGSGTIIAPSWRKVLPGSCGASSAGTEKLIRHVPGAAPISDGGSGIATNRCRTVPVSTTSIAWPRSSGRRRRHRPVTRTVTLRPPSFTNSTASIPSADGRSLIGRDGTAAGGRNLPSRGATRTERGSVGINWRRIAAERQMRHRRAPRRRSPQARASGEPRADAGGSTACRLARPHIQELCNPLG